MRIKKTSVCVATVVAVVATSVSTVTAYESVSVSPDVAVELGAPTAQVLDEDVAITGLGGMVMFETIGALPHAADVSGYESLPGGDQLLCFDTTVGLPGPVDAAPGDVVRYDGVNYSIEFDASANGVADGVLCDAVTRDASGNLVLSFDVDVALPDGAAGTVVARDEDLVRADGPSAFSVFLDGAGGGVPGNLDVDGAHVASPGGLDVVYLSFDTSGEVGGVSFADEDIVVLNSLSGDWMLAFDGSAQDVDWEPADVDALFVPEPGATLALVSGIVFLALLGRRRG